MKSRLAIVTLAVDGLQTLHGGVGRLIRNAIDSAPQIRAAFAEDGWEAEFHFVEPWVSEGYLGYSPSDRQIYLDKCNSLGGRLWRVPNASWGEPGPVPSFDTYMASSAAALQVILQLAEEYGHVAVLGGDHYFALVPELLATGWGLFPQNISFLHLTHSDVPAEDTITRSVDERGARALSAQRNIFLGAESAYMRRKYQACYSVADSDIIMCPTGIPIERLQSPYDGISASARQALSEAYMDRFDLADKGMLALAWGRASEDKGFDILIEAFSGRSASLPHLVVCTPNRYPELEELARRHDSNVTFLQSVDDFALRGLIGSHQVRFALFASKREPAAVAPLEAMWFGRDSGLTTIAWDGLCYRDTLGGGEHGVLVPENTVGAWQRTLTQVFTATESWGSKSESAGRYVSSDRSFTDNFINFVRELLQK